MVRTRVCAPLLLAIATAWTASGVRAQNYRIESGELRSASGAAPEPLEGRFALEQARAPARRAAGEPLALSFGFRDFELRSGTWALGSPKPLEYRGRRPAAPLGLQQAPEIVAGRVDWQPLRAGGELSGQSAGEVRFSSFELRADPERPSLAIGSLGPGRLPRRIALHGSLYRITERFSVPERCPAQTADAAFAAHSPAVAALLALAGSPLQPANPADAQPAPPEPAQDLPVPADSALAMLLERVAPRAEQLPGDAAVPGPLAELIARVRRAPDVPDAPAAPGAARPPTLAQLGIRAGAGVELHFDAAARTVRASSPADLVVEPKGLWAFPDVARIELEAAGDLISLAPIQVMPPTRLALRAGQALHLRLPAAAGVDIPGPWDVQGEPLGEPSGPADAAGRRSRAPGAARASGAPPSATPDEGTCAFLIPTGEPSEQPLGEFSLVASAAQPLDAVLYRAGHRTLRGAIFGSPEQAVEALEPSSIAVGAAQPGAEPTAWRVLQRRADLNGDGRADLLLQFTGVQDAADGSTCLLAATVQGEPLERCAPLAPPAGTGAWQPQSE